MFEHLTTTDDLFTFRLGTQLSAEYDSLEMLEKLQQEVTTEDLRQLFAHHAEETRQQIANVQSCFSILGIPVDESPSPTTKGLASEAASLLRKSDETLANSIALSGGLETEHYEIAAYTTLIDMADARGQTQVVDLLRANLEQEKEASRKIETAARSLSHSKVA